MEQKMYELEDIIIDLNPNKLSIEHSHKSIFTSFRCKYLNSYADNNISSEQFDDLNSLQEYDANYPQNYRRFIGSRYIHFGSLINSGFLSSDFDLLTFRFDIDSLISAEHKRICNHDLLSTLLFYGKTPNLDIDAQELFKEEYKLGDELLLPKIDLKKATYVLTYKSDSADLLSESSLSKHVAIHDCSEVKKNYMTSFFK